MELRLENSPQFDIAAQDMKDGEIGVITRWPLLEREGNIVMRYLNDLIQIGCPYGKSWPNNFTYVMDRNEFRVRLLAKGEKIVIE